MKKRFNEKTLSCLLGAARDAPFAFARQGFGDHLSSDFGYAFDVILPPGGTSATLGPRPRRIDGASRFTLIHTKADLDFAGSGQLGNADVAYRYEVPLHFLRMPNISHTLYNVRFSIDGTVQEFDEQSSLPLRIGYYGITGRHPLTRFREHYSDALAGRGHLLHKTWSALLRNELGVHPVFQIAGRANSLSEIYRQEERAVEGSLAPKGLNVIPGGEAGIKMLHELRLLGADRNITPMQRDAALVELERGSLATHYRSGHIRRLSPNKFTWVKPCWVNLERVVS